MKKLIILFCLLPVIGLAGGPGKPGVDETEIAYGLLILFLAMLYGMERGFQYLRQYIRHYLQKRREAHTLSEQ